ncbi:MAG: hybrid sensor histidine kinase/response regulator [Ignavibacteria bacterium]|nr:hybrid sensor histidine kinase/response regulator [Ignavibacteria bacterium]
MNVSNTDSSVAAPSNLSERSPCILIVDDMMENLQALRGRLRLKHYSLSEATSGSEALDYLQKCIADNAPLPDLILLDVQMPEMDGFEVCRILKADENLREIPVIFITARSEMDFIVEGFNAGAVDYVIKPFHATELLTRVKTHLDLKFSRDSLRNNNELLEKLNREKSEFMGIAAHDLKNPLATVRWLTDSLKSGTLPPEKSAETLDNITLAVERMFRLVKNLLDVNAIEEGAVLSGSDNHDDSPLHLPAENINLVFAAADVLANYEAQAAQKSISTTFANNAPNATIRINAEILSQILDNLISNALKYSPRETTVSVNVSGNEDFARVSVQDEGVGIPPEEASRLFTKFGTLSAKPTGGEDSTGLGLFIVKKLTEAAGGSVHFAPADKRGSIFSVQFPVVKRVRSADNESEDDE